MQQNHGEIVPIQSSESQHKSSNQQPIIVVVKEQPRPSHYQIKSHRANANQELWLVIKFGIVVITTLLSSLIIAQAIISYGNANFWANERQYQHIWNHPAGGQY